ncbi:MAG: hypothetical protein QOF21_1749, partial [Actinomycetota bacterium]
GVDVFFVLSGFLITGLLVKEFESTGTLRLLRFSGRRLLRLYPALVVLVVCVVGAAIVVDESVGENVHDAVLALTYTANWPLTGTLLSHTWTLALEEQFYLVWPVLYLVSHRRQRFRPAIALALIGCLVVADIATGRTGVLHTYIRATGLPIGCALALSPGLRSALQRWAAPAAVLLIVCFFVDLSPTLTTRGPISIGAVLSAPVVAGLSAGRLKVLAWRLLPWLGLRSYSLYLWHLPVISIVRHHIAEGAPTAVQAGLGVAASVVAAVLSYRFVERPGLALRDRKLASLTSR